MHANRETIQSHEETSAQPKIESKDLAEKVKHRLRSSDKENHHELEGNQRSRVFNANAEVHQLQETFWDLLTPRERPRRGLWTEDGQEEEIAGTKTQWASDTQAMHEEETHAWRQFIDQVEDQEKYCLAEHFGEEAPQQVDHLH